MNFAIFRRNFETILPEFHGNGKEMTKCLEILSAIKIIFVHDFSHFSVKKKNGKNQKKRQKSEKRENFEKITKKIN